MSVQAITYRALSIAEKIKIADRLAFRPDRPRPLLHRKTEIALCVEFDRHNAELAYIEREFDRLVFDAIRRAFSNDDIEAARREVSA